MDKKNALAPLNIVILVLKILMDLVSRVLIFFIFMIVHNVHNNGRFSPWRTVISFYTTVGFMFIFNIVFNERRNFKSFKYWLGECCIFLKFLLF